MSEEIQPEEHETGRVSNEHIETEAAVGEAATGSDAGATLGGQVEAAGGGLSQDPELPNDVIDDLAGRANEIKPHDIDAIDELTPEQKYEAKVSLSLPPESKSKFLSSESDESGHRATVEAWIDYDPDEDSPDLIEQRYAAIEQQRARQNATGGDTIPTPEEGKTDAQVAMTSPDGGQSDPTEEAVAWATRLVREESTETCLIYLATLSAALAETRRGEGQ